MRSALLFTVVAVACGGEKPPAAEEKSASAPADPAEPAPATAPKKAPEQALGRVLPTAPLPVDAMLGSKAADAETQLGEPTGKGMMRKSCVRFLPERTWFDCEYAEQTYEDPTGNFEKIGLQFTDGVVTAMSWEGMKGEGPVDPTQAVKKAGLALPGEPSVQNPADGVTVWSYFNSAARLRLHDKEFRVEVSTVENDWARTKVQILENHHLTPAQKAKVIDTRTEGSP